MPSRPIKSHSCLTFDCYGTLVDWEGGIYKGLAPLTRKLPPSHQLYNDRLGTLRSFIKHESRVQSLNPTAIYSTVLGSAYGDFSVKLGLGEPTAEEKARFGASVGEWPVFPDTVEALRRLQKHFKLVILSNVDWDSFRKTLAGPLAGVDFDAVYVAEDIGSYKPDLRNFRYLVDRCRQDLGVEQDGIIHTAQSLFHDLAPAKEIGLAGAWIERGEEVDSVMGGDLRDFEGKVDISWRFRNMREMADFVESS
ncbi:Haloacid dehalogenase-like hydrolase [Neofusicoccum parvum]|uniref:Haloacid dehalogenase-like hydrolase n=2 Tax=Neofusicoccum parvum TaxID=310453 RepID=A0ACB5RXR0_9PEZI|nr:putative haloacid dehalogenase protein [Neofusicoccum parvum UCRNP2]GME25285.1 Haloacid dehalogenase-like hydrolase [Neofusicoccum parvum]GME55536.1 Haloacid dehalogenase-like hydrolase [Neofusicoccum parvum]